MWHFWQKSSKCCVSGCQSSVMLISAKRIQLITLTFALLTHDSVLVMLVSDILYRRYLVRCAIRTTDQHLPFFCEYRLLSYTIAYNFNNIIQLIRLLPVPAYCAGADES